MIHYALNIQRLSPANKVLEQAIKRIGLQHTTELAAAKAALELSKFPGVQFVTLTIVIEKHLASYRNGKRS